MRVRYASSQPAAICLEVSFVLGDRERHAGRNPRRAGVLSTRPRPRRAALDSSERSRPRPGGRAASRLRAHPPCEPTMGRAPRRGSDPLLGRRPQPKRPDASRSSGRRAPSSSASTATSVVRIRSTGCRQLRSCKPRRAVAAGPQAEGEAAVGRPLQAGHGHGDRGRRAAPDREAVASPIREVTPAICAGAARPRLGSSPRRSRSGHSRAPPLARQGGSESASKWNGVTPTPTPMWGPCPVASEVVVIMLMNCTADLGRIHAPTPSTCSQARARPTPERRSSQASPAPCRRCRRRRPPSAVRPRALARLGQGPAPLLQGIRLIGHQLEASKRLQR